MSEKNFLDPNPNSDPTEPMDSEHNHASREPEESNGYDHDHDHYEVPVELGDSNQEPVHDNGVSEVLGDGGDSEETTEEAGRDDMFVDCPDELVSSAEKEAVVAVIATEESGGGFQETENVARDGYVMDEPERLSVSREYKEEREAFAREVAELRHGLKALIFNQQPLLGENGSEENDTPLLEMIKECSQLVKTASEERLWAEATIREIRGVVFTKEREIEDLNARATEYLNSVQNSLEKDRYVEYVANGMLASLGSVGYQEEPLEDSISGKVIQVERGTSLLIEKYNQILSEIDQLKNCLFETGIDIRVQEDHGTICVAARDELLELKKKEVHLVEKVRHLEDGNRKLMEQLDRDKEMVEKVNAELANTKLELEHEKARCANTKEKLTMAVTKGKALVQQRDSLKHAVADKTSELEKCLIELQEKSSALEAAELSKGELVKSENLIASLQETLLQRNSIVEKIEEIIFEAGVPEELHSKDIIERFRWLLDERNVLKDVSLESQKLKDAFSSFDLPETVSSSDLEAQVGWLRESFYSAKDEVNSLQDEIAKTREAAHNEIDRLSASLSTVLQEKDYLQTELADLMSKYEEIVEKEHQVSLEKDLLSASLSAELQEKDHFRTELADLMGKYKENVEKEHQVSLEKDRIMKMLLEVSGTEMENEEGVYQTSSDNSVLIRRCFEKIKEQSSASSDSSNVNTDLFERVQSLLYVRDQELMLTEKLLEEEMMVRSEVEKLSNELKLVSEELVALKEEKGSLQKDFERSEEKSALLREKLSMAVKKGKGLVQDRENLKNLLEEKNSEIEKLRLELQQQESAVADCRDQINKLSTDVEHIPKLEGNLVAMKNLMGEKNSEIEKLRLELQQQESAVADCRDQINTLSTDVEHIPKLEADLVAMKNLLDEKNSEIEKLRLKLQQQESAVADCRDQINTLSTDVEHIPKLEADLVAMKDQRDQLEQFLLESNKILQKVVESIDGIVLPVDAVFEDPVGKVNWLSGYINECLDAKTHAEQELGEVKEDASTLASKLAEAQTTVKSLEDALSVAENDIFQLSEEKREIKVGKTNIEQELQKAIEEACSQTSKFVEACATRKSLEESLSLAENNVSVLFREKEEAQVSRAAAVTDLEKVKEEVAIQTSKLTEAYKTIKSLEDSLSQAETNVSLLTEQNNDSQVGRSNLESELKMLQEEAGSQANKLADAYATIKSLEDALLRAENNISVLQGEKKNVEEELFSQNSKLNACMEELAGTSGSFESRSLELAGHLNDLQVIMKDETLLSTVKECFERKFEGLRKMDLILKNIRNRFVDVDLKDLQSHHAMEDDSNVMKPFSDSLNNIVDVEMENSWVTAADGDSISSHFGKTVEGFQLRNKHIADKFEGFSSFLDEFITALLRKLQETQDGVVFVLEHIDTSKQKSKNLEMFQQEHETTIAMLENDVTTLLSACTDATRELQFEVKNNLLELSGVPELEKLKHTLFLEMTERDGDATLEQQQRLDGSKHVKAAEALLIATRKVQALVKQFESTSNVAAATVEELQDKLKESRTSLEKAVEERDLNRDMVSKLKSEVEELQSSCNELRLKLEEEYQIKDDKLKEREAEVSSLYNTLLMKEQGAGDSLLSASQVKTLFEKVGGIEVPMAESEVGDLAPHNSAHVNKLFYIIDTVTELQHHVKLLSHDKEELQSTLTTQILEIEHLKEEVERHIKDRQDSEKMMDELSELTFGLEKIIGILGGSDLVDQKSAGVKRLLSALEKQVMTMHLELEKSKSKAQEIDTKLLASEKVVDELSIKVKVLEDSRQDRSAQPEIVQERSIFEAPSVPTGSEISEIEDVGSVGQSTMSSVPAATHVRTLRKGSTDQLAINIDVESERLINNERIDEDKGHVFKSLNASGLIPKQGKLIADRIDGIWVSGGRVLMSRPRARLGLIAYWLFMHIWLLGMIL